MVPSGKVYLQCKTMEQLLEQLDRDGVKTQNVISLVDTTTTPRSRLLSVLTYRITSEKTGNRAYFKVSVNEDELAAHREKERQYKLRNQIIEKYPLVSRTELPSVLSGTTLQTLQANGLRDVSICLLPTYPEHSPEFVFVQMLCQRELNSIDSYFVRPYKGGFCILKLKFEGHRPFSIIDPGLNPWTIPLQMFERDCEQFTKKFHEQDHIFMKELQQAPWMVVKEAGFPTRADFVWTRLQERKALYGDSFEFHPVLVQAEQEAEQSLMRTYEPDQFGAFVSATDYHRGDPDWDQMVDQFVPKKEQKHILDTYTDKMVKPKLARRMSLGKRQRRHRCSKK
jgi:hypothetical protein